MRPAPPERGDAGAPVLAALLFDVDGTLAETERDGHLVAFNESFRRLGLGWHWTEARYAGLLQVAGGRERLLADLATRADAPADAGARRALVGELHRLKNEVYAELVRGGRLALRDGIAELLDECRVAGFPVGIVSTTSAVNVAALLGASLGPGWRDGFACVICGEHVPRKKPDPAAYLAALAELGVAPGDVIAIEDSPAGLESARGAGLGVVITYSHFFPGPCQPGALAAGPSLGSGSGWTPAPARPGSRIGLRQLREWHAAGRQDRRHGS